MQTTIHGMKLGAISKTTRKVPYMVEPPGLPVTT
jgi:hypothetical protein